MARAILSPQQDPIPDKPISQFTPQLLWATHAMDSHFILSPWRQRHIRPCCVSSLASRRASRETIAAFNHVLSISRLEPSRRELWSDEVIVHVLQAVTLLASLREFAVQGRSPIWDKCLRMQGQRSQGASSFFDPATDESLTRFSRTESVSTVPQNSISCNL